MKTRIYLVIGPSAAQLVRATSQAQAISYVCRSMFSANVANQEELAQLLMSGIKIEDASKTTDEVVVD